MGQEVTQLGQHIVIKELSTGCGRVEFLDPNAKDIRFLKKWNIPIKALVGLPFGATIRREGNSWVRCKRINPEDFVAAVQEAASETFIPPLKRSLEDECSEGSPASSEIIDNNSAQRLKAEDVVEMKRSGISGVDLVSSLITSSESYSKRNEFSKEKYIKRKFERHVLQIGIYQVDPVTVAEVYGEPAKIGGLRPDTIGSMLSEANVCAGRRVLIFDHSTGYLTANVLSRLGGEGLALSLVQCRGVSDHIARQFNLSEKHWDAFHEIPYPVVIRGLDCNFEGDSFKIGFEEWFNLTPTVEHVLEDSNISEKHKKQAEEALGRRRARFLRRSRGWEAFVKKGIDSFVICADSRRMEASNPHQFASLLSDLYRIAEKRLRSGGRLSIYCSEMNPLAELYVYMKARKFTWANLRFEETLVRRISVLPGRSHPQMEGSLRLLNGFHLSASRMAYTEREPTRTDGSMGDSYECGQ